MVIQRWSLPCALNDLLAMRPLLGIDHAKSAAPLVLTSGNLFSNEYVLSSDYKVDNRIELLDYSAREIIYILIGCVRARYPGLALAPFGSEEHNVV